jgi:hypothetical protein
MIFLTGSINTASQSDMEREASVYQQNGWEFRDPTTHKVAVTIAEDDIEEFCEHLRSLPRDKRLKEWTDRSGVTHKTQTISFYLKGTEMSATWVRLRGRLDNRSQRQPTQQDQASNSTTQPSRRQSAPPINRPLPPRLDPPQRPLQQSTAQPQAPGPSQAPRPTWNPPQSVNDDDVPF